MQMNNADGAKFIAAGRFSGSANVSMHKHEGIELVFVVQGECGLDVNGDRLKGGVDTLFILPPNTLHNQLNKGRVITDYIIFKSSDKFSSGIPRQLSVSGDRWISRWITDILDLYKSSDNIAVQADNLLAALIDRLKQIENHSVSQQKMHPALVNAVKIIESDIARERTVQRLASSCNISQSHLNMLFRRHFGCGPLKYLQDLRMRHARKLLAEPYLSIKEIGLMCGYEEVNYFCRIFKRHNRISPGSFRMENYKK
ncbi:MAG: AraC family transcriptional regulator [Victivallaceae bacterium]|jgi:AraC-like DNA-binding protein